METDRPANAYRVTGPQARIYARVTGASVHKFADPLEPARDHLTDDEIAAIYAEDPELLYVDVILSDSELCELRADAGRHRDDELVQWVNRAIMGDNGAAWRCAMIWTAQVIESRS